MIVFKTGCVSIIFFNLQSISDWIRREGIHSCISFIISSVVFVSKYLVNFLSFSFRMLLISFISFSPSYTPFFKNFHKGIFFPLNKDYYKQVILKNMSISAWLFSFKPIVNYS